MNINQTITCRGLHGEEVEAHMNDLSWRPSIYAVIVKDDKVLLAREWDGYDFPGGAVEMHESLDEALSREVFEETGMHATLGELLHIKDDFFVHPVTGKTFHTLCLFYVGENPHGTITAEHRDAMEEYLSPAEWVPIDEIDTLKFYNGVDSPALIRKVAAMQ